MSDEQKEQEERAYYLRLVSMYIDIGTETVLGVFEHHSPGKDAEAFLRANENHIIRLKTTRLLNKQECALLLRRLQDDTLVLKTPLDLKSFDVSLLITLARKLFEKDQLPLPADGWNNPPRDNDKSIAADLLRLKRTRNDIVGHHPRARLPKWKFKEKWEEVSEIILRLQQQIAPGNEVHIKEKIEKYRLQKLDPSVGNKYDEKLKEWHKEVTKIQDQVEELIEQFKGFDSYLKTKSDRFETYTKLLLHGGHFVLSAFLSKKIEKKGRDLRSILDDNKDILKTNITDSKQLDILYPPANITDPLDTSSWDVSLLATVILQLFFRTTKDRGIKQNVKRIGDAHKSYADARTGALDSKFEEDRANLKASLQFVSDKLDDNKADRYYQILEECEKGILQHVDQTYIETQASEMKNFKDTVKKTKEILQDMITNGISFKNDHELDLKMITLGNNEEKKEMAEEMLTTLWHEAMDRSLQTTRLSEVKEEVKKILEEIRKSKSVTNITIKTACILLKITCTSPSDMLNMMNYFESESCHKSFVNISKALRCYFDTALTVYSVVPINWLWAISNLQSERGVRLPITVSSPAGMKHLISLCRSEKITNSTNSIADALSKDLDHTIELKMLTDLKELEPVFETDKSRSENSSDCSATESSVHQLNQPDDPEECHEGQSPGNMPEESTEQQFDDKTDHLKEVHKDDNIKKQTEPVTIPQDINMAFPQAKREKRVERDKSRFDSNNDCSAMESSVVNSNQINQPDVPEEFSEGKSPGNMPEESTEQQLDDKTVKSIDNKDHLKEIYKDDYFKEETELTIPRNIYTASPLAKREKRAKRVRKNQRYRNWVRAGLELHILKTELNKIWDEAVEKQHKALIDNVKKKKGLSTVLCNKCNLQTLLPDHVQTEHKQCPLGYLNCNCLNPVGKSACPNNLCGSLYDDIIRLYKATPPTPFWENTNVQTWCTDPWSIAKCFISISGHVTKTEASEFDIKELLLLRENNKELLRNRKGEIHFTDLPYHEDDDYEYKLWKVCHYKDMLYHTAEMELDWVSVRQYRQVFEDGLYFVESVRTDVSKFLDDDYIVSIKDEALVHADVIAAISEEAKCLEHTIQSNEETIITEKEIEDKEDSAEKLIPVLQDAEDYKMQFEKVRLENTKTLISVHKEKLVYIESKLDIQKRLVKLYQGHVVKVPALPIQPEQNQKDVDDVYVDPWMTVLDEDEPNRKFSEMREKDISSFFEVFKERGKQIKNVYVLGEAGTGKSTFCKSMVQKWCKVHMEGDMGGRLYLGKEKKIIKRFDFLFLVLLRHHSDKPTIKMMLEGQFGHPALQKLLDTESEKCLIILDGLEEWISKSLSYSQIETEGLPARDNDKDYTVIATSRPWTIGLLGMKRNEIHKKVVLRGIDKNATETLAKKTIKLLNATFEQKRSSETFIKYLKTTTLSDIQHIPILLQQLICLWYENSDLTSSSRCTLYRGMLELSFKWLDQKKRENYESDLGSKTKTLPSLQSPHVLDPARMYADYQNTINSASKLAFEVLFKQQKENTISFGIQTCKRLQIPVDVLKVCLNIGILCEDKTVGFTAVGQNEASFSFVHKSIQEFLAAVHIADIFKTCSLTVSEQEKTMSIHSMTEQENATTLRHLSELDDTRYLRHVSEDIAPRHHVSELDDILNQHPHSEREDIKSRQSCSLSENITSLHTCSMKDDIISPQTVSEREHMTSPHSSSQFDDVRSPNISSVPGNITSPHQSSLNEDMAPLGPHSERDDTASPYHRFEREDMSGREYACWADVCQDFIQKSFARIVTIENILEVADVFVFLSGLKPRLATYISKYIHNVFSRNCPIVQHRKTLDEGMFLNDIQKCISGCCDEANSNTIFEQCTVYLRDCFLDDSESVLPSLNSSTALNIIPDSIESLSVSFSRTCPLVTGRSKCDICRVLTQFSSCRGLTKLALKGERTNIDDGHIRLIQEILETNLQSLRTVSVSYHFGVKAYLKCMESFEPLIIYIPKLNQLTSLKLQIINLPHEQCNVLESYLADTFRLQELSLDIECKDNDDHEIDMATHHSLQYLETGDSFTVKNVNKEHDMTVKFKIKRLDDSSINRLFLILESVKLKYVSLWGNRDGDSASAVFTRKLCSLLAKSSYLYAIELDSLEITDNILTLPYRLASLKRIDLLEVTMTIIAWEAFIHCLPYIPNAVHVKTLGLVIRLPIRSVSPFNRTSTNREPEEPLDYVRNHDELFHITRDDGYLFEFSTRKNDSYGD